MGYFNPITTVRGNPLPQLQRTVYRFDPVRGWLTRYEWNSADQASAITLSNNYALQGIANSLTLEHDKASVEAEDSTTEYAIDSWELVANDEARDLFSDPDWLGGISTIMNTSGYQETYFAISGDEHYPDIYDFVATLRSHLSSDDTVAVLETDPMMQALLDWDPDGFYWTADYYSRQLQGATSYRSQQYVLKHKSNVSNRWTVNIADFGVNQIYTPAQLLNEVSSSALWIFPLPARLQYKIGIIPAITTPPPPPEYPQEYLWGWLKSGSTETTDALNRITIETTYSLYLWDEYVYDPYDGSGGNGTQS